MVEGRGWGGEFTQIQVQESLKKGKILPESADNNNKQGLQRSSNFERHCSVVLKYENLEIRHNTCGNLPYIFSSSDLR